MDVKINQEDSVNITQISSFNKKAKEAQKLVNGADEPERGAAGDSVNRAVKEASHDR